MKIYKTPVLNLRKANLNDIITSSGDNYEVYPSEWDSDVNP